MANNKLHMLNVTALFAAIISILAQVNIPLQPVPITGQTLAIGLAATILGKKYGTLSVLLYLLIGSVGVPVFAEMSGGLGVVVGPTGGYLLGFIPSAFLIGWYIEKTSSSVFQAFIANVIGMVTSLVFGTIWLKFAASISWTVAISTGVLPFILVGLLKAFLAAYLGVVVKKRLKAARLLKIA